MRYPLAVAVALLCWLALPAGAAAQGQGLDVTRLTQQVTTTATGAVASTGAALESTVRQAAPLAGPAQGTVENVAQTVGQVTGPGGPVAQAGSGLAAATRPVTETVDTATAPVTETVEEVLGGPRPAEDSPVPPERRQAEPPAREQSAAEAPRAAPPPAGNIEPSSTGAEPLPPAGLPLDGGDAAAGAPPSRDAKPRTAVKDAPSSLGPPAVSLDLPTFSLDPPAFSRERAREPQGSSAAGASHDAARSHAALGTPSGPEPPSGPAGGSASSGAFGFSTGGLALLLAALCLMAPALRRRLPRRPVIAWPAAFVPLLERPG